MEKKLKTKSLMIIFLCALCWGPSYLFIKIAVPEIPPITLVLIRVAIGFIFLYAVCRIQKKNIMDWKHLWMHFAVMGITLNALPFTLVSFGELYISSSLTGVLNSSTLIFTAIFAHFFGFHDPLTKNKILGISVGILGLMIIYLPMVFQESVKNIIGALLVIIACLSYGTGTVYARTHLQKVPGIIALTIQLLIATIVLIPLSLFVEHPFNLPLPSYGAILGALALGVIGTAVGFYLFYKAIYIAGSTYASLTVLIVPVLAIILGTIFLHEHLTWNVYLGSILILIGVFAINPILKK